MIYSSVADEDFYSARKCLTNFVWATDIHDQAVDLALVPPGFHTKLEKQNLLFRSSLALDEPFLLSYRNFDKDI